MSLRYLSLFSGLEAAHLAWQPLGWTCAAVAEIDPPACAVLAHRLPGVPNLGDVSQIGDRQIAALGHIDVVIGGSPCQDLSVAGKRAGLAGARSGLFHEQLRIFHAARTLCGARWLIWENVPGAFSSNKGRDFAVVVGAMAGCELPVPADGWGSEGVALGDSGLVEWAVLDAQWFGVAQRRRRVFAVLDTGDWASRPPVLLEPDSLRGDSPPRREAGQGAPAGVVRSVALRGREGGGAAELGDEVGGTLRASGGGGDKAYALVPDLSEDGTGRGTPLVPVAALAVMAHGQSGAEVSEGSYCPTLTCNHEAPIVSYAIQAGALRQNPESGPDGVGVQTDHAYTLEARAEVQCVAFAHQAGGVQTTLGYDPESGTAPCLSVGQVPAIAFGCKDSDPARGVDDDVAPTLRAMGHAGSHANAGGQVAVAFAQNQRDKVRQMEVAGALAAEPGTKQQTYLRQGMSVRRLTPREAERLQGAPDNWTLVPNAKGKPMADGPRYKMLGNSFAVPVVRHIGAKIMEAVNGVQ